MTLTIYRWPQLISAPDGMTNPHIDQHRDFINDEIQLQLTEEPPGLEGQGWLSVPSLKNWVRIDPDDRNLTTHWLSLSLMREETEKVTPCALCSQGMVYGSAHHPRGRECGHIKPLHKNTYPEWYLRDFYGYRGFP